MASSIKEYKVPKGKVLSFMRNVSNLNYNYRANIKAKRIRSGFFRDTYKTKIICADAYYPEILEQLRVY